jgi:phage gp29-like protein
MIAWCERTQSKALVAGTLTSDSTSGTNTNALGSVHEQAFFDLVVSDAKQASATLTRDLVYPLQMLNLGKTDRTRRMRFVFDTSQPEDLESFVNSMGSLIERGAAKAVPISWFHDRSGIPMPRDGEQTLADLLQAVPVQKANKPEALAALSADQIDPDLLDAFADELASDWERVTAPMLNPIFKMLEEYAEQGRSLEDFRNDMAQSARRMDTKPMAEAVQRALFNAYIAGRIGADV